MSAQPDAFLSYTRLDDEFFGGAISSLRDLLELGVRVVTGQRSFSIFQDSQIEVGEQWQQRLDQAIKATTFLIPVITPLFFQSDACRDELTKFIAHEKEQGRSDLILPVYFVTVPALEKDELRHDDQLATLIAARQRYDWRTMASLPSRDPQVRSGILQLSDKIAAALARASGGTKDKSAETMRTELSAGAKDSALAIASEAVPTKKPNKTSTSRKQILWVDDRPDNNIFERRAMQAYSIEFDLAESTGEALGKLRKKQYDAIISDMGRPPDQQAGYTLLSTLRSSGNLTPFFIYAGSNDPTHLRLALSKGAQGSTNRANVLIANILNSLNG